MGIRHSQAAALTENAQVPVEHLAAHLAGRERDDTEARWDELLPAYTELADQLTS